MHTPYQLQLQEVACAQSHFFFSTVVLFSSLYCDELLSAEPDRVTIVLIYRVNVHCQ